MRVLITVMAWSILMCTSVSAAVKIPHAEQIQLQVTMKKAINARTVDGKFNYFDAETDSVVSLYPAKSHSMILKMGESYILCSDFRNESGKKVSIDFYVVRKDDSFAVIDTVIGNRDSIRRMMKKGAVVIVK